MPTPPPSVAPMGVPASDRLRLVVCDRRWGSPDPNRHPYAGAQQSLPVDPSRPTCRGVLVQVGRQHLVRQRQQTDPAAHEPIDPDIDLHQACPARQLGSDATLLAVIAAGDTIGATARRPGRPRRVAFRGRRWSSTSPAAG